MTYYKYMLGYRYIKHLCVQGILTQKNFHSSLHFDMDAKLGKHKIKSLMEKDIDVTIKRYLQNTLKINCNSLPLTTTCCWTIRIQVKGYSHIQCFVGLNALFAYNVSCNSFVGNNYLGAIFLSSLFLHCTSIPIWIDSNNNYHLKGPANMYVFAWGKSGGSAI